MPKLQADPSGLNQANSKRKLPPKNKRIQKLIAPKLKADPSGLNQANSKRGQEMKCAKMSGSKRHALKIVRSTIGGYNNTYNSKEEQDET